MEDAKSSSKGKRRLDDTIPIHNPITTLRPGNRSGEETSQKSSSFVHEGVTCDGPLCDGNDESIKGIRYHCRICDNTDFCSTCVRSDENTHDVRHELLECFERIEFVHVPRDAVPKEPTLEDVTANMKAISVAGGGIIHKQWQGWSECDSKNPSAKQKMMPWYQIDKMGQVTLTEVPIQENPPRDRDHERQQVVTHHNDKMVDVIIGKVKLYPYPKDQLYQDAWAGIPSTRVIDLQPGQGDDKLQCEIRTIRLKENPDFEALSYTWKETKFERTKHKNWDRGTDATFRATMDCVHPIYCGPGHFFLINTGLRDALQRLRHPDKVGTLWADQICINQNDVGEKNYQVRNMLLVYHRAAAVTLWTGEEDEHTNSAFLLMELLAYSCLVPDHLLPTPQQIDANTELDLPPTGSPEWASLLEFYNRPVFERMWVIQEVLAGSEVTVKCGDYELEFWKVGAVANLLCQPSWITCSWRGIARPDFVSVMDTFRNKLHSGGHLKLSEMLLATEFFQQTDFRDAVFALLGAPRINYTNLDDIRDFPQEDYNLPETAVFTMATKYIIEHEQRLSLILSLAGSLSQMPNLPTWVPEWSSKLHIQHLWNPSGPTPYCASADTEVIAVWPFNVSPNLLATSSFQFSKVKAVGRPYAVVPGSAAKPFGEVLESWAECACQVGPKYPNGEDTPSAFIRTLVGNTALTWTQYPVPVSYMRALSMFIVASIMMDIGPEKYHEILLPQNPLLDALDARAHEAAATEGVSQEDCNADLQFRLMTSHRRFFVTENGYFGLGSVGTQVGDEVHVISGCHVPFIFRMSSPADEDEVVHHRLLGESYVHGIMDGEACERDGVEWGELFIE